MSLQVCHCGWAKVTTYHGLRTHQGKMGCTLKGAKVAQCDQQYMWSNVGLTQMDLMLDVSASFKTDTADIYSEIRLQVCDCGWSKLTTYRGLRIHQGKMGCTPKGMKMPKREQYDRKSLWDVKEEQKKHQSTKRVIKKENVPRPPSTKVCTSSAPTTATVKEEYNPSFAASQYSSQRARNSKASHELVHRSVRDHPTPTHPEAVVRPKEKRIKHQTLAQATDNGGMLGNWCNSQTDYATIAAKIKEEPKSPIMSQYSSQRPTISKAIHQLQDFSTDVQGKQLVMKAPTPAPIVHRNEKVRKDRMLSQNAPVSSRNHIARAATIMEEPKPPLPILQQPLQRATNSKSVSQLQDSSTSVQVTGLIREHQAVPPLVPTLVQLKEKHRNDQTLQNTQDSRSTNSQTDNAAAEAAAKQDPKPCTANEITEPDFPTGMTVKKLAQMFSASTVQATAVRPKNKQGEQPKVVPHTKEGSIETNPTAAQVTVTQEPPCELAQLSDFVTGMKVKDLARMFSATKRQETVVRPKQKYREEQKLSQIKLLPRRISSTTAQDTKVHSEDKDKQEPNLTQSLQQDAVQPHQGGEDTLRLQIDSVFSEVVKIVEDAKQKSHDLPLCTLRTTTLTMMEQIHQKLDKLSSAELNWISKFSVDVKLDPTTARRCLVSADGMKVIDRGENRDACDTPGSSGSVLGLDSLLAGKSYWEVEVSRNTGWDVGVARGNTNRERELALNPNNGFWVIAHYENKEYAALTEPPVYLSLKEKPQKVGVFVNYKEGLVSFYDVTAHSHIYSFTECLFTGEIFPYFSVYLKEDGVTADPLIMSSLKHQ